MSGESLEPPYRKRRAGLTFALLIVGIAVVIGAPAAFLGFFFSLAPADQGRNLTFNQAQSYFTAHRSELEQIMEVVHDCRPGNLAGDAADVRADATMNDDVRCYGRDPGALKRLVGKLNDAGVLIVSYDLGVPSMDGIRPSDPGPAVQSMTFTMFSGGLSVSGSTVDIEYTRVPEINATQIDDGGSYRSEKRALTGTPYNWFWKWDVT